MGNLGRREATLARLRRLPAAVLASDDAVLSLVVRERLFGTGMSYVDAHLLASTLITPGASLWTYDRALRTAAERLGVAA